MGMVQNQWICDGLVWSKRDQPLTVFTGILFQIPVHCISACEPPVRLLELNVACSKNTYNKQYTFLTRDILITASYISYVNYRLTHNCVGKRYSKSQHCS